MRTILIVCACSVLLAQTKTVFFITGQVHNQGSYRLDAGMTVGQAIAAAGGATERADLGRITVQRVTNGTRSDVTATVDDIVRPDDLIAVGRKQARAPAR